MESNFISNFTIEFVLVIDSVIELKMWFFFIRGPPVVGLCFHVRGRNDWKITFFTQFSVVQMLLDWMWKSNGKNFFCHKHKFYTFQLVYLQPDNVNSFWHLALELGKAEKHSLDLLLNRTNDRGFGLTMKGLHHAKWTGYTYTNNSTDKDVPEHFDEKIFQELLLISLPFVHFCVWFNISQEICISIFQCIYSSSMNIFIAVVGQIDENTHFQSVFNWLCTQLAA